LKLILIEKAKTFPLQIPFSGIQ